MNFTREEIEQKLNRGVWDGDNHNVLAEDWLEMYDLITQLQQQLENSK